MSRMHYVLQMIVICCTLSSGCADSGPRPVRVIGTVLYQDKPLSSGDVVFIPVSLKTGHVARGKIDADGRFTLTTDQQGEGAFPDDYKVTVFANEPLRDIPGMAAPAVGASLIPTRYNDAQTTDLQQTVGEKGEEITLVLTE